MTIRVRRIAIVLACLHVATAVAAPPQVEIRAQTKLALDQVHMVDDEHAEVRGQLLDNLTGEGIGGQTVRIKVGDETATAVTRDDGSFRTTLPVVPGTQAVELAFRGGGAMTASQLSQTTDPARAQVVLTMEVQDAPGGARVVVRATADDQAIDLPIALTAGAPGDARLAAVGTARTGASTLVTRKAAGGAGPRRIRATFTGDDTRQTASVEKTVELSVGTTTTIDVTATAIAYEDDVGVTGKVTDEDGQPMAHAAVALSASERRIAQGATGEDGSYKFRVEGEVLGQGPWAMQVQFNPASSSVKTSRSEPRVIKVAMPQPVPVSYTILAFVATAAAAGGFFMARAKPWHRFRRAAPPAEQPTTATPEEQLEGGLVANKPGLVSTLRRASDDGFSGAVRDTVRGRPVSGAVIRLRLGDAGSATTDGRPPGGATEGGLGEREATSAADGSFAFEALAPGDWLAEAGAPGHVTETFVVSIPHRGELRGVRVDLVPVRERVFQLYRRAAEPVLPEPRLWGVWSPRQIVDHVRGKRPSPALADLTDFVEDLYFSARVADEAVLPDAADQVDRAIRERARTQAA